MTEKGAWLVAGLGFGDEGKGSTVDYLVRREEARAVIRYNGGAQAGHRVVLPDGREHIFAQFSSGTLVPRTLTHLSRFMLVEPFGMMKENEHLQSLGCANAFARTTIEETAPVITPFHIAANRLQESARGQHRHGSCGLGIGETMEDVRTLGAKALVIGDFAKPGLLRAKLSSIRERKLAKVRRAAGNRSPSDADYLHRRILESPRLVDAYIEDYLDFITLARVVPAAYLKSLLRQGPVIFEGAQGMMLDPKYGFPPHITKTDITYRNALTLLRQAGYGGALTRVGVLRGYYTRHGNGPFASEDDRLAALLPDAGNKKHPWQGKFRVGWFDLAAAKYALDAIGGIDELSLTCLDRLIGCPELKIYDAPLYRHLDPLTDRAQARRYAETLADGLHCRLGIASFGPTAADKITIRP